MKVLIVGRLEGHITEASKIAIARGAKVAHVNSISEAMKALRSGQGAEVAMVDVNLDVSNTTEAGVGIVIVVYYGADMDININVELDIDVNINVNVNVDVTM